MQECILFMECDLRCIKAPHSSPQKSLRTLAFSAHSAVINFIQIFSAKYSSPSTPEQSAEIETDESRSRPAF